MGSPGAALAVGRGARPEHARPGAPTRRASTGAAAPTRPQTLCTCIRFWVRVPVLSVQITSVEPSVSTALSRLTSPPRRARSADAHREGEGDGRQQALRARWRPATRCAKTEASVKVRPASMPSGRKAMPDADGDSGDQPGDPSHLQLERAGLLVVRLRESRDASELGRHAGVHDQRPGPPRRCRWCRTAATSSASTTADADVRPPAAASIGLSGHGRGLPGHRRHVQLDRPVERAGHPRRPHRPFLERPAGRQGPHSMRPRPDACPSRTTVACGGRYAPRAATACSACRSWTRAKPALTAITATIAIPSVGPWVASARAAASQSSSASGWVSWRRGASRPLAFSTLSRLGPVTARRSLGLGGGQPGAVAGQALEQDGRLHEQQVGVGWERRLDDRVGTHLSTVSQLPRAS